MHKTNLTFHAYIGWEHNFFGFKDGQVKFDDFYWNHVRADFLGGAVTHRVNSVIKSLAQKPTPF